MAPNRKAAFNIFYHAKTVVFFCIVPVIFLFFTVSCNSQSKNKEIAGRDSTVIINLPAPGTISTAEFSRIKNACELWYDSMLEKRNFNGGMIVAKKGTIIFERYSGTGHLGKTDTITANTPTHVASVSKTFTAMAVLKLVQDGKVMLDDEFNKYFPAFNYPGITVRNLLNHRSGLPNYQYFMEELGWDKHIYIKDKDVLDYLITRKAQIKNISSPDTHFTYCNTNYVLLALLIEKVTGISYPEFIKRTFFVPLQMTNSFVFTQEDSATVNPSYDWKGTMIPMNFLDQVYGDKNIYTTARDLLKWDRALSTNLIFKPEILEQAYTPYSNEKAGIRNYGLGWHMYVFPGGRKIIYHNGWWHGNNAVFIRLIQDDATIILTGNRFTRGIYKARNLVTIFYPDLATDPEEDAETKQPAEPVKEKKVKLPTRKKGKRG